MPFFPLPPSTQDVRLTFANAVLFNPPGHWVANLALSLTADFEKQIADMVTHYCGVAGLTDTSLENINKLLATYPLLGALLEADASGAGALGSPRAAAQPGGAAPLQRANSFDSLAGGEDADAANETKDGEADGMDFAEDAESPRARGATVGTSFTFDNVPLRRRDSVESTGGDGGGGGDGDYTVVSRRPLRSGAVLGAVPDSIALSSSQNVAFDKPELGFKGAMAMMNELAKNVDRLKVDLFVVHFAPPGSASASASASGATAAGGGAAKRAKLSTDALAKDNGQEDDNGKTEQAAAPRRPKGYRGKAGAYLRRIANGTLNEVDEFTIPAACLMMLQGIASDTSDPDAAFSSPFVDTRHTFLEMCQFRHYQFDSLRRAKHSSLMLLYHLHNPHASHLRPKCKLCSNSIQNVRWHCGDGCANYDVCDQCYKAVSCRHPHMPGHKLFPFRITFS